MYKLGKGKEIRLCKKEQQIEKSKKGKRKNGSDIIILAWRGSW